MTTRIDNVSLDSGRHFSPVTRERPILFSGPMVRALLAGTKTQTRRTVRLADGDVLHFVDGAPWLSNIDGMKKLACPYGAPGDRLWVRETWALLTGNGHRIVYRADADPPMTCGGTEPVRDMKWTPSIYMRRQHSRITLEITDVRVERLTSISEQDARAEGCFVDEATHGPCDDSARDVFTDLWDSINGKRAPWSSNPWVWAISFKRVTP